MGRRRGDEHGTGARAPAAPQPRPSEPPPGAPSGISVALCTLNGGRFLRQQLDSILAQSRRPDQLVLSDDGSGDGSVEIALGVLRGSGLAHRVVRNPARLGVSANFEQAIRLCEHELIAFCDQDDVWHPDKLSRLEAALRGSPSAAAVFSDARAIDTRGKPLGFSQWQACWFGPDVRAAHRADLFPLLIRYPVVCGATLAVRRDAALRCLPIGAGWLHDEWIAVLCSATSRLLFLEEALVDYRIHGAQSIGLARPTFLQRFKQAKTLDAAYFRAHIGRFEVLSQRLEAWRPRPPPAQLALLASKLLFLQRRAQIRGGSANPWLTATGQLLDGSHHRFGHGFKSWLLDIGYDLAYGRAGSQGRVGSRAQ